MKAKKLEREFNKSGAWQLENIKAEQEFDKITEKLLEILDGN